MAHSTGHTHIYQQHYYRQPWIYFFFIKNYFVLCHWKQLFCYQEKLSKAFQLTNFQRRNLYLELMEFFITQFIAYFYLSFLLVICSFKLTRALSRGKIAVRKSNKWHHLSLYSYVATFSVFNFLKEKNHSSLKKFWKLHFKIVIFFF